MKQELKIYKPEVESSYEQTATIGSMVLICVLTRKNSIQVVTDCELRARKIPFSDTDSIKQNGEDANLDEIPISVKKAFLKPHESCGLTRKNISLSDNKAEKMTNLIRPFSDIG